MSCLKCGKKCIGEYCFQHKPRKPMQAKKRMRKVSDKGRKLMQKVADWKAELKPPYRCHYCLYLGIDIPLEIEYLQAEHTKSKVRHPGFKFDADKWVLACPGHNAQKSSKDIEEFLEILDKEKVNAKIE